MGLSQRAVNDLRLKCLDDKGWLTDTDQVASIKKHLLANHDVADDFWLKTFLTLISPEIYPALQEVKWSGIDSSCRIWIGLAVRCSTVGVAKCYMK